MEIDKDFMETVFRTDIRKLEIDKDKHFRKYVLTGGPGCGKSTLAKGLEKEGFDVVPEMARAVIDYQLSVDGDALPWKNRNKFQEAVIIGQALQEQSLPEEKPIVLDRAMPDNLAYLINDGNVVPEYLSGIFDSFGNYEHVFIPDPIPYVNDYARRENEQEAMKLHDLIGRTYRSLGNTITEVPIFHGNGERAEYVTGIIKENEKRGDLNGQRIRRRAPCLLVSRIM